MNHEELDVLIDCLERDVESASASSQNAPPFGELWSRVKHIGGSFREVRYRTREEKDAAWSRFQSVVDRIKRIGEERQRFRDQRLAQRERESAEALREVMREVRYAWPWDDDALLELIKIISGAKILEVVLVAVFDIIDNLMGGTPLSPEEQRKIELKKCSKHMGDAFRLFGQLSKRMTQEDRTKAYELLNRTKGELDRAWSEFNEEQQKKWNERNERREKMAREFAEKCSQKEKLITIAESLDAERDGDRDRAKELTGEWKSVGFAGKQNEDDLWRRFSAALDQFWKSSKALGEARKRKWEARESEFEKAREEKREIIAEIDRLEPGDRSDSDRIKDLQRKWKITGSAGKEWNDRLWAEYRESCDRFFSAKRDQMRSRLDEVLDGKREHAKKLEDWVDRDESSLSDAKDKRDSAWNDSFREKMEEKIEFLENRIESNRSKLSEVEDAISDIESRLRNMD